MLNDEANRRARMLDEADASLRRLNANRRTSDDPAVPLPPPNVRAGEPGARCVFELEKHLQDFLRHNWERLSLSEEWELRGFEHGAGDVGRIDLLAHHRTQPRWLVIELKRQQTSDETVGQVLRYMGWVKQHLAAAGDAVEGMVISHSGDEKIRYALMHVPNVTLYVYDVALTLKPV